jgi:hypothetical protein
VAHASIIEVITGDGHPSGYGQNPTSAGGTGTDKSAPTAKTYFISSLKNKYGFDAKNDCIDTYITIKSNDESYAFVGVTDHANGAAAKKDDASDLTISPTALPNGETEITIKTLGKKAQEVLINGCTGQSAANDCYTVENTLFVKVYGQRDLGTFNSTSVR